MNSYDAVPYPNLSYSQSHPDRLATIATLVGMSPAPLTNCRVLEIGCASGGNLIPMAERLPSSQFVGIDLSARQIAAGQAALATLGLKNIALHAMDIRAIDEGLGMFDYIIAHGVFSWVPREVQERLLDVCRERLSPQGVAYISYNVYPGWHLLGAAREMMRYHTRKLDDPQERARRARGLIEFLMESFGDKPATGRRFLRPYVNFLRMEREHLKDHQDALLLHDELEEVNEPCYFYQFSARAAQHGLQYVSEADFSKVMLAHLPSELSDALTQLSGDLIELEQYLDFVHNNSFRQTLLCHQAVQLNRALTPERLRHFYVTARARPETSEVDVAGGVVTTFRAPDDAKFSTDHPLSKMALLCLMRLWPSAIHFDELLRLAQRSLREVLPSDATQPTAAQDAQILAANLLKAYTYSNNLVDLHRYTPAVVDVVSERPLAGLWTRYLAAHEMQTRATQTRAIQTRATNVWHERVSLDEFDRFLVQRLDGQHDRAALLDATLRGPVANGQLALGDSNISAEAARAMLMEEIESKLRWYAFAGLLIA